jgi:membrane protein
MLSRRESRFIWLVLSALATVAFVGMHRKPRRPKRQGVRTYPVFVPEPLEIQEQRAREHGRGRRATTPFQIPWSGWKDILLRTWEEILNDRLVTLAGGVSFYSLIALFPAIAAGVSFYALFADAGTIGKHLVIAADIVPASALDVLGDEIARIAAKSDGRLTFSFVVAFAIALWSANAGMKALFDALNVVYDEQEKRSIIRLNVISLVLTVCAIVGALVTVVAVMLVPLLLHALDLSNLSETLIRYLRWPALFVLALLALAMVYRHGPSRRLAKWRWITVGSVVAAFSWLAVSSLFSYYLSNFANYDATYGALGAAVGLMMWIWLSVLVVLIGAELNSEIEHQTAQDSTVGPELPLGYRGAVIADTVGVGKT